MIEKIKKNIVIEIQKKESLKELVDYLEAEYLELNEQLWDKCQDCGMCCSLRSPRGCVFLDKKTMKCKIYPIRPMRCRTFKFDSEICKLIRKK